MIVIKRRLIFWLLKAYIKRWGKVIFLSFLLGLVIFFVLKSSFPYIIAAFTGVSKETIGVVGAYTLDNLPPTIVKDISEGLTQVNSDGSISPAVASSWEIKDNGKLYIFHLKKNIRFNDGTPLTSNEIKLSFTNVVTSRPDAYTISYRLNDSYAPFLVTVSKPIFRDGLIGIGNYRIKKANINGSFLENLTLTSSTVTPALKIYQFYPTAEALKVAFALGEITKAINLPSLSFQNTSMNKFPHTTIVKTTNYTELVTLFYNTKDKNLSDKKLRDALSYALPNIVGNGERAYTPIPPTSWAYNPSIQRLQDLAHAKLLLSASIGDVSKFPPITISTLLRFEKVALEIKDAWEKIGIKSNVQIVDSLPSVFQIYLGSFTLPEDPDQYTLWHSYQENNITNYSSIRIDKLLEDGRKTLDKNARMQLYLDFQKYLQDDQPATFLYYPYNYTVTKT